jgi:hypothetical protein
MPSLHCQEFEMLAWLESRDFVEEGEGDWPALQVPLLVQALVHAEHMRRNAAGEDELPFTPLLANLQITSSLLKASQDPV